MAAAALLAGCGDSGEAGNGETEGVVPLTAGSTAQFASCGDWVEATEDQRYKTIADIRGQLTPQNSETAESDLSDDAAYELFEHSCEPEWAANLRLYKLYAHAQPFAALNADE